MEHKIGFMFFTYFNFFIMKHHFFKSPNYEPSTKFGKVIEVITCPDLVDDDHLVHILDLDDFGSSRQCSAFKSDYWDEAKVSYLEDMEVLYCGDKLLPWSMQPDELKEGYADFIKRSEKRELRINRRERLLELLPIPLPSGLRSRFLYGY